MSGEYEKKREDRLRLERFACAALTGLLNTTCGVHDDCDDAEQVAETAWEIAAAMEKTRP